MLIVDTGVLLADSDSADPDHERCVTAREAEDSLIETYADLGLGGTDASLIAIAERLQATTIATLDGITGRAPPAQPR